MKKKFFAIYALVGALVASPVFTSCVDDEESASVTALRDAKAEQLKAAAALANAQAQAETIIANAEAAYKAAEAAYKQAQADAMAADAAHQAEMTKQAQETFAITIAKAKAQAELELLMIQNQIQSEKNNLEDAEYWRFTNLYNRYLNELSTLTNLKQSLVSQKADLASLEAGILTEAAWDKYNSMNSQRNIERYKARLAVYNNPDYAGLDSGDLYAKMEAANKEANLAEKAFSSNEACGALEAASEAVVELIKELDEYKYIIEDINNAWNGLVQNDWAWENTTIYTDVNYWCYSYDYGNDFRKNVRISEAELLNATRNYASNVSYYAEGLGKADDTKEKSTAYGQLAAANAAMEAAKALAETTDAEKAAKKTAIEDAETAIANAKDNLAKWQKWYDEAVEAQTEFAELVASLDIAKANKAVEDFYAAREANEAAEEAYNEAKESVQELWDAYYALNDMYWNESAEIKSTIANLEALIAQEEQNLIAYQQNGAEITLANAKELIAQLEARIAIQEEIVAAAKAKVDEYLGSDEEVEEETEETPAE